MKASIFLISDTANNASPDGGWGHCQFNMSVLSAKCSNVGRKNHLAKTQQTDTKILCVRASGGRGIGGSGGGV